jgi:hypothetical protein
MSIRGGTAALAVSATLLAAPAATAANTPDPRPPTDAGSSTAVNRGQCDGYDIYPNQERTFATKFWGATIVRVQVRDAHTGWGWWSGLSFGSGAGDAGSTHELNKSFAAVRIGFHNNGTGIMHVSTPYGPCNP